MIVSDSTTLIILFDLKRTELLSNLFDKVTVPEAVYRELTAKTSVDLPNFMEIKPVAQRSELETLMRLLDRGESEAILLAMELKRPLIIDEKKGRKIARQKGVEILGLLGILYLNVKKGFLTIEEAREFLDAARNHGYRIAERLIDEMLEKLINS